MDDKQPLKYVVDKHWPGVKANERRYIKTLFCNWIRIAKKAELIKEEQERSEGVNESINETNK